MCIKKFLGGKNQTSAKVVDGKLILSCPGAVVPVVWQMDLGEAKASALEVKQDEGKPHFVLIQRTQKGSAAAVATFEARDKAIQALMEASKALESAHGKIALPANENHGNVYVAPTQKKSGGKWIIAILLFIVLFLLFGIFSANLSQNYQPGSYDNQASAPQPNPAESNGVPVSADDFLNSL